MSGVKQCLHVQEGDQMPEDWRTLVDANLFSINTKMVPQVSATPQVLPNFCHDATHDADDNVEHHICCAVVKVPEGSVHVCLDLQPMGPVRFPGLQSNCPLAPLSQQICCYSSSLCMPHPCMCKCSDRPKTG